MQIEGPVNITCVKVFDEIPEGQGGYPSYQEGGVGFNYVIIGVATNYGKGFHFFIQIFGVPLKDERESNLEIITVPPRKASKIWKKKV